MRGYNGIVYLVFLLLSTSGFGQEPLFKLGEEGRVADQKGALVYSAEITLQPSLLQAGKASTLLLPLPTNEIEISLRPIAPGTIALKEGQAAWDGQLKDGSHVFLMRLGEAIEARIANARMVYRIRSRDGQKGVLEAYNTGRFREAPGDGVLGEEPRRTDKDDVQRPDSSCTDSASIIDIMVLYTPDARDASGGAADIENEIAFAVGVTNKAYADSSVFHRLNLIYVGEASFNEPASGVDSNALLGQLQDTSDGVLDTIHGVRDSVRADLVSLFYEVDDSSWCGWGHTVETADADTTDHRAFSVVQRGCASANLSFPHEVGHNLGAKHDRDNASGTLDFNFGHIQPVPSDASVTPWRTIMSYNCPCCDDADSGSCMRIGMFSNPNISFNGDATGVPLGDPEPEHNVQVFAQNDGEVARYRCLRSGSAAADVWMKDRWEDTGDEPDPATTGKAMWQSPYIWVRLAEDTALEHEHEHENPVLGATNFVYVKLHNSGASSETGDVELYFADASTNLNDPANWTQIDSTTATISSGTQVASFEWSGLPGTGHFCLLARWNTSGAPLSFTNINTAVRNSNDLIWRNVNIIDMAGGDADMRFLVAGHREFHHTYLLIETVPLSHHKIPWNRLATATLQVEKGALNEGQLVSMGLERVGAGEYRLPLVNRPKLLGPFQLPPGKATKVGLRVKTDQSGVKAASKQLANDAHFEITAIQISPLALNFVQKDRDKLFTNEGRVIGGVSYTLTLPAGKDD